MVNFVLNRLREPSTYAGLAGLAAAVGIAEPLYLLHIQSCKSLILRFLYHLGSTRI
jgi:hypothetical protein